MSIYPKNKPMWRDRALTICAYYFTLCLSEKEMQAELERLEVEKHLWPRFKSEGAHAGTNLYASNETSGQRIALVCFAGDEDGKYTPIQVAALLVHEAVHVWQAHTRAIGSLNDHGDEEEAYAIQNIAQELFEEYVRRMS